MNDFTGREIIASLGSLAFMVKQQNALLKEQNEIARKRLEIEISREAREDYEYASTN